jgi:hypothetical protein
MQNEYDYSFATYKTHYILSPYMYIHAHTQTTYFDICKHTASVLGYLMPHTHNNKNIMIS